MYLLFSELVFRHDNDDEEQFSAVESISSLVKYVDSVCAVALQRESANILLSQCVLQFFELVSSSTFFYIFTSVNKLWLSSG